jgi:hypothetical protein
MVPAIGGDGQAGPEQWCEPIERSRPLRALIGQREVNPAEVWERGDRISAAEYHYRMRLAEWATEFEPTAPEARPREPVDLTKMKAIF